MTIKEPLNRPKSRGFTLIELLVVIGIIVVLISILVPVVASARRSAQAADSRNQVKNIANACDRYYNDFQAYPGIFANAQCRLTGSYPGATPPAVLTPTATPGPISMSENLVITLLGGNGGTAAAPSYVSTDVGRGVLSYSTVPKRYAPYLEATPASISMNGAKLDRGGWFGMGEATLGANTGVPEFIDRFPGAMPILYFRAKVGAAAAADITGGLQYDAREFTAYAKPTAADPSYPTKPGIPPGASSRDFNDWNTYFMNTSLAGTARQQDTYILISPGVDRTYGTADDITNFQF